MSAQTAVAGSATPVVSKSELVYSALRDRILSGTYREGHRLVFDRLAREFNVSPFPVREAVRRLEAEGLVEFTPNVGAEVARFDASQYDDAIEALAYLEGICTALAAPHLTRADIAEARQIDAEMDAVRAAFDARVFSALNDRFHEVIFRNCPNARLIDLMHTEHERVQLICQSLFSMNPGRAKDSIAEHEALLDLIERGATAATIEAASREHRRNTMAGFHPQQARLPSPVRS